MTDCTFFYDVHGMYLTSFFTEANTKGTALTISIVINIAVLVLFLPPSKTAPILQSKYRLYFLENISKLPLDFLIFVWDHGMYYLYHIYLCSKKSKERSKFTIFVSSSYNS